MVKNTIANSIVYTTVRNISQLLIENGYVDQRIVHDVASEIFVEELGENIPMSFPKKKAKDVITEKVKKNKDESRSDPFGWETADEFEGNVVRSTRFLVDIDVESDMYGKSLYLIKSVDTGIMRVHTSSGDFRKLTIPEKSRYERMLSSK